MSEKPKDEWTDEDWRLYFEEEDRQRRWRARFWAYMHWPSRWNRELLERKDEA